MIAGGIINTASHGGNPLTNFVDGAFEGGLAAGISGGVVDSGLFGSFAPLGVFGLDSIGEGFYYSNRNGLLKTLGLPSATDTTSWFGQEGGPARSAAMLWAFGQ